jgi:hypothetical protein
MRHLEEVGRGGLRRRMGESFVLQLWRRSMELWKRTSMVFL